MDLAEKLEILADSAKYDVACTSSGVNRPGRHGALGSSAAAGICHAFTADGRCVSLLKVLYSNVCSYDCSYCVNRRSNDRPRATFTPRELAELTIGFYRRNYIEGLFLSSAVLGTPDRTMELMIEALRILREEYHFNGYIHAKTIPGADPMLVEKIGRLADRLSVNIELPSETSLTTLAPDKKKTAILRPMGQIAVQSAQSKKEMVLYRGAKPFAPAGQSTQMIDRGDAGDRPPYHGPDRGTLQEILAEARVLFGLSAGGGGSPPARTAHGPSPAARAPSVSGGLAAAVLPFFGAGAADRGRTEF